MMASFPEAVQPMQVRCHQCRSPVPIEDHAPLSRIACPSCGSDFSLIDETIVYGPSESGRIGQFEIVEELGVGAFGTVFKARDSQLDRIVAVKVPLRGRLEPAETEMFLREARAAARLKHANIVSVHEVGRENGSIYIVSDFVEGMTLADWLTGQLPTFHEAARLCSIVARAVHHAHEAGVIHRDLKPGNILLDRAGVPHVTDFGLARRETGDVTMTVDGKVIGTPAYMSPEQARGEGHRADRRSDVYSIGVILFELLTGEKPFRGNTRMMLHQVLNEEPPSPRSLNSHVPHDLETICLKCLQKEPDKRYATAAAFADDLAAWLSGAPIKARPVSALEKGLKWVRRRPAAAGFIATSVVALLASVALGVGAPLLIEVQQANLEIEKKRYQAQHQLDRANKYLYRFGIFRADLYWQEQMPGPAIELLTNVPVDNRDWEWHYLHRKFHPATGENPAARMLDLPGSPVALGGNAGNQILSVISDGTVHLLDLNHLESPETFAPFHRDVADVAIASTAGLVAATCRPLEATDPPEVYVWSAASRRMLLQKALTGDPSAIQLADDGTRLAVAVAGSGLVELSIPTGQECLIASNAGSARRIAYSRDGGLLAAVSSVPESGSNRVVIWNSADKSVRCEFDVDAEVFALAFTPSGSLLVGTDSRISVWETTQGTWLTDRRGHSGPVRSLAFNPTGTRLISVADDGALKLWDWTDAEAVTPYSETPTNPVGTGGPLRRWGGVFNEALLTLRLDDFRFTAPAISATFNSTGEWIISSTNGGTLTAWDGAPQYRIPSRRP